MCVNAVGTYYCDCADGTGNNCYDTTTASVNTPEMVLCDFNHCENGGSCFLDADNHPLCKCSGGFTGEACDVIVAESRWSANVGLIAGLSVLGAVLLIVATALIFYFFVYPRFKGPTKLEEAASAGSHLSSEDTQLTKFDTQSTRINKFWPKGPQRYAPQTYNFKSGTTDT
jgi:hypothetical protein